MRRPVRRSWCSTGGAGRWPGAQVSRPVPRRRSRQRCPIRQLAEEIIQVSTDSGVAGVCAVGATRHAGYLARRARRSSSPLPRCPRCSRSLLWSSSGAGSLTSRAAGAGRPARASAECRGRFACRRSVQGARHPGTKRSGYCDSGSDGGAGRRSPRGPDHRAGHRTGATPRSPRGGARGQRSQTGAGGVRTLDPGGHPRTRGPGARRAFHASGTLRARNQRTNRRHRGIHRRARARLAGEHRGPVDLSSFADEVLAPIDRAESAGTLLETLHAWLAGDPSQPAPSAFEFTGTLSGTASSASRNSGRDVDSVDAQTELWLALKARGLRDES